MSLAKNKQRGHAMILFVMIIPALFGLFTLASDGTRAMQTRARVADATEAASLAVAAQNSDDTAINEQLVRDYLNAYEHTIVAITNVQVVRLTCEQIPECVAGVARGENRYFEYDIDATASFHTWFSGNDSIEGFGESFSASGGSTSQKIESQGIDVVLVADFSGSMINGWSGSSQAKYIDLINIIKDVTDELKTMDERSNDDVFNTIGIVPFVGNTRSWSPSAANGSGDYCFMRQEEVYVDKDKIYTDYDLTLENLFVEKDDCAMKYSRNIHQWPPYPYPDFYDIQLTSNYDAFDSAISTFRPGGITASYQGWIRGAQILNSGTNARRLMILLSDGRDNSFRPVDAESADRWLTNPSVKVLQYADSNNETANQLVDMGMCDLIRRGLNDTTPSGQPIEVTLAVIGFDYNPNSNKALVNCVGENNVYTAQNPDELY